MKIVALLELLHEKVVPLTAQAPLELVSVNPEPEVVAVNVAHVCVLHVPAERKQPTADPEEVKAVTVDLGGGVALVPVGPEDVVVVVVEPVDFEPGADVVVVRAVDVVEVGFKLTLVAGLAPDLVG